MLLVAMAACGGDSPVGPQSTLAVAGRLERGLVVRVGVRSGTDTTLQPVTAVTVTPADAATVLPNGDVRLTKAGSLTISATAGTATLSAIVAVLSPPVIVFDGLAAGNRDIYSIAIDGGELTRLTTNGASDQTPTATGSTVLYTSYRDGNAELYTLSLIGAAERRITTTTFSETQSALSPDGRKILYSNNATGFSKIWLATFDPSATVPVGTPERLSAATFGSSSTIEASPSWTQAADRIAMMTTATPTGGAGLFLANAAASSTPVLVTGSGTSVEVEPSWSFNGFFLAYASPIAGATEIFVRDTRTGTATQLTRAGGSRGQPAWLPDGRVVFTTFSGGTSTLSWVDPALPLDVHAIATTGLSAEHAAPVRP